MQRIIVDKGVVVLTKGGKVWAGKLLDLNEFGLAFSYRGMEKGLPADFECLDILVMQQDEQDDFFLNSVKGKLVAVTGMKKSTHHMPIPGNRCCISFVGLSEQQFFYLRAFVQKVSEAKEGKTGKGRYL